MKHFLLNWKYRQSKLGLADALLLVAWNLLPFLWAPERKNFLGYPESVKRNERKKERGKGKEIKKTLEIITGAWWFLFFPFWSSLVVLIAMQILYAESKEWCNANRKVLNKFLIPAKFINLGFSHCKKNS